MGSENPISALTQAPIHLPYPLRMDPVSSKVGSGLEIRKSSRRLLPERGSRSVLLQDGKNIRIRVIRKISIVSA